MTTVATKAAMREERASEVAALKRADGFRLVAYDRSLGTTYSADPTDYFWLGDEEPLTDAQGTPLVLAWIDPRYTGPASHGDPTIEFV